MTDRTHGPFEPGTLCVIVDSGHGGEGLECTVVRFRRDDTHGDVYDIEVNHPVKVALAHALRRRPDSSDQSQWQRQETTDWSKCAWQPQRTEA